MKDIVERLKEQVENSLAGRGSIGSEWPDPELGEFIEHMYRKVSDTIKGRYLSECVLLNFSEEELESAFARWKIEQEER